MTCNGFYLLSLIFNTVDGVACELISYFPLGINTVYCILYTTHVKMLI